jgi:hypothetical protein
MTLNYKAMGDMITSNETYKREMNMYGMTTDDIRTQYMAIGQMTGLEMVVAGILSDVQELTAYQHAADVNSKATKELIRKQLNVAKFVLFEMMDQRETA